MGKNDSKPGDYDAVRASILEQMDDETWDDGSYAPILIRLAWHSAGTFCKNDKTGGSDGACMRHQPEAGWGANAGLGRARDLLGPVCKKHPHASTADVWIFAGVVAVEEMSGGACKVGFREGRTDKAAADTPASGGHKYPIFLFTGEISYLCFTGCQKYL
jgi:catalase (peroxidase I)